jgi:hypothetical protein
LKIKNFKSYNGARDKINRLGLRPLVSEVIRSIRETRIFILEQKGANGTVPVRTAFDNTLLGKGGWAQNVVGDIDWIKDIRYNNTIIARLGVEFQISARSDLVIRDLIHLRNNLQSGNIDVGIIIVPTDRLSGFFGSRYPTVTETIRYIEDEFREAQYFPLLLIGIEHDGPGTEALPKQKRKS